MSCYDGKRSSLMSCFLVWYALFCFLLFLFYVLLYFLLFSSVCFSTLTIFKDVNTFVVNGGTELQNFQKVLPSAIPLGHSILSETRTCRSTPFIPAFSIFACVPQSDQYMNLGGKNKQTNKKTFTIRITAIFVKYI